MTKVIDGSLYLELMSGGVRNLEKHRTELNELNVFPVPDGDTGTNMVMTLKYGLEAAKSTEGGLSEVANAFAASAVYGARGNSGVIVSQFFKGIAERLGGAASADSALLAAALVNGYKRAYSAVAKPVEGTMLTVMKDSAEALSAAATTESIDEAMEILLAEARQSLERTPSLLPILKKAGVVDSGGAGVCRLFEGMRCILAGESIEGPEDEDKDEAVCAVDFSLFNTKTRFEYGYCVEGLIQLGSDAEGVDLDSFRSSLSAIGSSIVLTLEGDKLKLHIHTKKLGEVMNHCQRLGEFLTIKIENMTVQNMQKAKKEAEAQKFLCREGDGECEFAVVAVATTPKLQRAFSDMGADVVILSNIAPSSQDFAEAFRLTGAKDIIVFPNSSNSILASMQAGGMCKEIQVRVLNCRSSAECYSSLSTMDFSVGAEEASRAAKEAIAMTYGVGIYHAVRDVQFDSSNISRNDFFSIADKRIISVGESLDEVTLSTVKKTVEGAEYAVLTLFYGENIAEEYIESLTEKIREAAGEIEISAVSTDETSYSLILAFE